MCDKVWIEFSSRVPLTVTIREDDLVEDIKTRCSGPSHSSALGKYSLQWQMLTLSVPADV